MIRERLIGQMRNEGAFCLYAETLDAPAGESHDVELPNMLHARELLSGPLLEMGCSAHFDFETVTGSGADRLFYSRALTHSSSSLTTAVNTNHHRLRHHPCAGATATATTNQFWPNGPLYQGGWHQAGMATGGYYQIFSGTDGLYSDQSGSSSSVFGSPNGGQYPFTMNAWVKVDDLSSKSGGLNGVHPVMAVSKIAPYGTVDLSQWKAVGIGFQNNKNTVPCIFEMSAAQASTGVAGDVLFTATKILGADEFRGGSLNTSTAPTADHDRWHMITGVFLSPSNVRLYWNGIRVADYESGEGKDASGSNESFSFPSTASAELSSTEYDGPFDVGHIGGFASQSTRVGCNFTRNSPVPEAPCLTQGKIGNASFFPSGLSSIQVAELYSTTSQAMTLEMDLTTAGTAGFLATQANKFDDALPQVLIEAHTGKQGSNGDKRSWSTGMWHAHMDLDTQTGRLTALNGDQSNSSVTTGFGFAAMFGGFGTPFNSQKSMNFGSGNKNVGFAIDNASTGPRVKLRDTTGQFGGTIRSIIPAPDDRINPTSDPLGKKDLVSGFFAMNGSGTGTDGVDTATSPTAVEFTHHLKDNFPISFFLNTTAQKAFLPIVFFNKYKTATEQLTIIRALKGNNPMRTRVPLTASPRPFRLNGSQTGRKIP